MFIAGDGVRGGYRSCQVVVSTVCGCLIGMFQICCMVCVGYGMSGSVVALVPAFNEERYVASVLVRLRECVDRVIVCDDGSVDLTGEIAEALEAVGVGMIRLRRV